MRNHASSAVFGVKAASVSGVVDHVVHPGYHFPGIEWPPALSSLVRSAALAAEKLVKLGSISKDRRLVHRLGALIPRRHLASLVQSADRTGVQILSQRRRLFSVPRNGVRWGYH